MGSANRVAVGWVRETTPGTTPNTPRVRTVRLTGESLDFTPQFVDTDELRSDRMLPAPIEVMQSASGGIKGELIYPLDNTPESDFWRSTFWNPWTNVNSRDNDGTGASVITAVATAGTVLTVLTGTAFVANELYRFSGFGVAGNNGVFKCTTGSATVPAFVGSGITDEASPAAAARVQCVGFIGASGDINATATGISSTSLDFTTIPGLVAGKWLKIGGTGAGNRFVTAALNDWVRITAVAAHALTFDNRPSGWTTETGTALTVKFWFGDYLRNGTTQTAGTLEKGFLDQASPTYIVERGMTVNNNALTIQSKNKITQQIDFLGMGGAQSTTTLDASYDVASSGLVMAANANVGRVAEAGNTLTSPNWANSLTIKFANNLRTIESIDSQSPVGILPGDFVASGQINSYFGDNSLLTKLYNGTATSLSSRIQKTSASVPQALIFTFPTVYLRGGGNPMASGKNTDVMAQFDWQAAYDSTYGCCAQLDRIPYYEQ